MGKRSSARAGLLLGASLAVFLATGVTLAVVGEITVTRSGKPVPDATVTLFGPRGEEAGKGRTDDRGVAVIPDLPRSPDELAVAVADGSGAAMRPPRMPGTPERPPAVDLDDEAVRACPSPGLFDPMVVGPKREVGAGVARTLERFLPGVGLPGGMSVGLGGDGDVDVAATEPDDGPPTVDDPFPRQARHRLRDPASGVEILVAAGFDERGRLRVGVEIDEAPGKGTLHAVALLSPYGDLVPWREWMIYKLWREWWLSVSWTRVTEYYRDGVLVNRTVEEGGWSERWREDLGTFAVPTEARPTLPLWRLAGFGRAAGGVRSAGFVYPVTPAMLQRVPFLFVAHVTLPKRDPVVTVPFVLALWFNPLAPVGPDNLPLFVPLGEAPAVALALDPGGATRLLAARNLMLFGAALEQGGMAATAGRLLQAGALMLAHGCNAALDPRAWLLPHDARSGKSAEESEQEDDDF